jgi:quaternary ammonium compound-resistance protein SugE
MAWIFLIIAGLLEVCWAVGLKYSEGFTKPLQSIVTAFFMILSFVFLSQALKTIPLGIGYAIWTGIGAVGSAILGIILFNEPRDFGRILCILLIICGLIGLKLTTSK